MQKNRVRYLDIYKGIGIILVVLGHMDTAPYLLKPLKLWLNAFHMPLFFVAAGVLIGELRLYERKSSSVIKDRARSILVPYFWFSLIAILWDAAKALLVSNSHLLPDMAEKLWNSLSLFGVSVLWFLPVFFVGVTGYQLLRKKLALLAALCVSALLAVLICIFFHGFPGELAAREMSVGVFVLKLSCVVLRGGVGMFFCAMGEAAGRLVGYLEERRGAMLLTGIGLTGIGTGLALGNVVVAGYPVSFCYLLVGNIVLFFGAAICLTCGILLLCCCVGQLKPLEYLGKYSMIIMVTHLDLRVLNIAQRVGLQFLRLTGSDLVCVIVALATITALELFCIWLFNGCLGFMLGKGRKKQSL